MKALSHSMVVYDFMETVYLANGLILHFNLNGFDWWFDNEFSFISIGMPTGSFRVIDANKQTSVFLFCKTSNRWKINI